MKKKNKTFSDYNCMFYSKCRYMWLFDFLII